MVEFDDPQYIEYCTNYGPAADLQKSEAKIAPSALGSFGAPRGAKKGDYYQVEATVVEGTPAGLYKYTIRICPAGNEVIPVDPGYRVKP
jgi:hypothetical protein